MSMHNVKIKRERYPELDRILWDIHTQLIPEVEAFRAYEERWGFVDQDRMSKSEKRLVERLTKVVGRGVFIPLNV